MRNLYIKPTKDYEAIQKFLGSVAEFGMFVRYDQPEHEYRGAIEEIEIRVPINYRHEYPEPMNTHVSVNLYGMPERFKPVRFGTTNDGMGFIIYERELQEVAEEETKSEPDKK